MVTNETIAKQVFTEIAERFPHFVSSISEDTDGAISVSLEFPSQAGLLFPVYLNLQHDELHLNAGSALWVEWFPCTRAEVVERYRSAVVGLLSGEYRIREHHRDGRAVKAELQCCDDGRWETVASWSELHLPLPWRKKYVYLQNGAQ